MSSEPSNEVPDPRVAEKADFAKDAQSSTEKAGSRSMTEEQLASPDRLTLRLLMVVFAVTMLCWVGAKAGCNRREVPIRKPAALTVEQARNTAKGAAIGFAQALASRDWEAALSFATPDVQLEVKAQRAACEQEATGCLPVTEVFTRAIVLRGRGRNVSLSTESHRPMGVLKLEVETQRDAKGWLVSKQYEPGSPQDLASSVGVAPASQALPAPASQARPAPTTP